MSPLESHIKQKVGHIFILTLKDTIRQILKNIFLSKTHFSLWVTVFEMVVNCKDCHIIYKFKVLEVFHVIVSTCLYIKF